MGLCLPPCPVCLRILACLLVLGLVGLGRHARGTLCDSSSSSRCAAVSFALSPAPSSCTRRPPYPKPRWRGGGACGFACDFSSVRGARSWRPRQIPSHCGGRNFDTLDTIGQARPATHLGVHALPRGTELTLC